MREYYLIWVKGFKYTGLLSAYRGLLHDTPELSLKSAAWICIVSDEVKYNEKDKIPSKYKNLFYKYTADETRKRKIFEFMGNDIDIGFRIKQFTYSRQLVLSFELAYLIDDIMYTDSNQKRTEDNSKEVIDIIHMGYRPLKGVWHDRQYPIFWYYVRKDKTSANSFLDSLPYDADTQNDLIKEYKNKQLANIKDEQNIHLLLDKIARNLRLRDKIEKIQDVLQQWDQDVDINDWLYNEDELHLHIAAVCCDFKNKRVFIAKRTGSRDKYSSCWEFGCAKAKKNQSFIVATKDEYKNDFNLDIELMISRGRKEISPKPYALYEIKEKNKDNFKKNKSDKGIIIYANSSLQL